jgi:hypothetical protein
MLTPRSAARRKAVNITSGSPACPPQARLALVTRSSIAASSPMDQRP